MRVSDARRPHLTYQGDTRKGAWRLTGYRSVSRFKRGGVYTPPTIPLRKAAKVLALGRAGNDGESVEAAKQIAERIGAQALLARAGAMIG